jgi:hypothetical protein
MLPGAHVVGACAGYQHCGHAPIVLQVVPFPAMLATHTSYCAVRPLAISAQSPPPDDHQWTLVLWLQAETLDATEASVIAYRYQHAGHATATHNVQLPKAFLMD